MEFYEISLFSKHVLLYLPIVTLNPSYYLPIYGTIIQVNLFKSSTVYSTWYIIEYMRKNFLCEFSECSLFRNSSFIFTFTFMRIFFFIIWRWFTIKNFHSTNPLLQKNTARTTRSELGIYHTSFVRFRYIADTKNIHSLDSGKKNINTKKKH